MTILTYTYVHCINRRRNNNNKRRGHSAICSVYHTLQKTGGPALRTNALRSMPQPAARNYKINHITNNCNNNNNSNSNVLLCFMIMHLIIMCITYLYYYYVLCMLLLIIIMNVIMY